MYKINVDGVDSMYLYTLSKGIFGRGHFKICYVTTYYDMVA